MATAPTPQDPGTEKLRIWLAFALAVTGLVLSAVLVIFLVCKGWHTASDVVAVVGLFTSVLGTLVGTFFGAQVGAAGKEKEQQAALAANRLAQRALAQLAPDQAREILREPPA